MISNFKTNMKKVLPIAYCTICLLVTTTILICDIQYCYSFYLSNKYQLCAEATIVNLENINFQNGNPGRDYSYPTLVGSQVGTKVYIYNIHEGTCDLIYIGEYDRSYAKDVPLNNLAYSTDDYKLLSGEKRYNILEYMQRIIGYTPDQIENGIVSGNLEKKIYQYFRVLSVLFIFDFLYVIYKIRSKKLTAFGHFMNGLMYVSSSFCLIISVLGIYIL